ncbi:hypothetical protein HHK36_020864 [Tetracentron sinense]|uniref:Sec39 domain-containing protein n=1 Tax=Tetracentron sinense TaxID=13715 RepID=A0A835D8R7_TETSI|nr:hypothetical protein HHK36_020864 [Tetracentron sinense]
MEDTEGKRLPQLQSFSPNSGEELNEGVKGSLLSLLSAQGLKQLKEKWSEYGRPRKLKKWISLFISPRAEHVAVAAGSQIIFLQKDDNYKEPSGIFTSRILGTFTHGTWSESHSILGVIDDTDTLYFIKANGEEITRITKKQLKVSASIIGLIVQDESESKSSCLCGFNVLTSDGLLHHIEVSLEPSSSISSMPPSSNHLILKKGFPQNVSCVDYHPELSLLVVVGSAASISVNSGSITGFYCLSLWRKTRNLDLDLVFSTSQFEGLYSTPKGYVGLLTTPKVVISPQGKFVATLDLTGGLNIFKLDSERCSLSLFAFGERYNSVGDDNLLNGRMKCLNDVVDFTWWSDHILTLANKSGIVTMLDVLSGIKLLDNDPVFSMPVLERGHQCPGCVFLLESTSSEGNSHVASDRRETGDLHSIDQLTQDRFKQLDIARLRWRLVSFTERSVSEMYDVLIRNQQYQAAMDFANRHGLNRDEVFKTQWLNSDHGINEIKMFLSNIKDQVFVLSECVHKVGPTEDAVKALLTYGLRITNQYRFSESEDRECNQIWDFRMFRLQLLQFRDKLETFVGINMGRFSVQEYGKFRIAPINEIAVNLAEMGKIGALNLLFKRHPYSLAPFMLDTLAAIPETLPVQTYSQLLPGRAPPTTIALRENDWVESEKMVAFINRLPKSHERSIQIRTETIAKQCLGFVWPRVDELSMWYKKRARDIDSLSGQLDNCLCMVDFACRKGVVELQQFLEDISYLYQLIYSDGSDEINSTISLVAWEQLSDYEKFMMMLKGVKEDKVVKRLHEKAIPFMRSRNLDMASASNNQVTNDRSSVDFKKADSFLVRWLKDIALENKLDICLMVIEEGCQEFQIDGIFKDEVEAVDCALQCIYLCSSTDKWSTMASILSKLPHIRDAQTCVEDLEERFKLAEGHVEAGRLLAYYQACVLFFFSICITFEDFFYWFLAGVAVQEAGEECENVLSLAKTNVLIGSSFSVAIHDAVLQMCYMLHLLKVETVVPKSMSFFLEAHSDEKGVKQILRLILSKFSRRQPGRSDNDWASMWRDMQCFQEKAFPFLEIEYMLMEFCRGLLKAGKFSLARNYLKGTGTVALATEKAENLVIQAAREYFFSASSLSCSEIWKAKECLNLFPNSKNVKAEADIIDALTIKLPSLGVTLLPMQFRQIRDPMEIIKMAITSQSGAYLDVDELVEISKLLGLGSQDDIAAVQEAIAREAAVAGDLQLAFDLCLVLAKKGHGLIWDLCAAMARGPALDNMDISSRKQLLGFALTHCDEESIGDLLHAWKDLDMQGHCEALMMSTGTSPPNFSVQGSSVISLPTHSIQDIVSLRDWSELVEGVDSDVQVLIENIKNILSNVAKDLPVRSGTDLDSLLRENGKVFSFAALQLPWLLELSRNAELGNKMIPGGRTLTGKQYMSLRMQAVVSILSWLARNDIAPRDDLIASLAKSIMKPPVTEEEDILGCSFLLNLVDAFHGVETIEEQLRTRGLYPEICSIMNMGMVYSSLHNSGVECGGPAQRRELLLTKFQEKHTLLSSDAIDKMDKVQTTFWREWKLKLEEQKRVADQSRVLEQIMPGVETARFLSGDFKYIESVILSLIDSIKLEKKPILNDVLKLADTYGLNHTQVLLRYLSSALVSEVWADDDIVAEISGHKEEILACAAEVINTISLVVYPAIDGCNKQRLAYIYSILSDCYLQINGTKEPLHHDPAHMPTLGLSQLCKVLEQECRRVSFIKNLNFKNVAGLGGLNFESFSNEVYNHTDEFSVEALAKMVQTLDSIYTDPGPKGLISWQDVYKHHVLSLLTTLETRIRTDCRIDNPDNLQGVISELEQNYDFCRIYIRAISQADALDMMRRYYMSSLPFNGSFGGLPGDSAWLDCLILLLKFWTKLTDDMPEIVSNESSREELPLFNPRSLSKCLKVFLRLVMEERVLENQGWGTVLNYVKHGLRGGFTVEVFIFCRAMVFSGCGFGAISEVFSEAVSQDPTSSTLGPNSEGDSDGIQNLPQIYVNILESVLLDLASKSHERQNLHHLLSSLSKLEGNLEDLKRVRYAVWERLAKFSDNMQLQSHVRVYALELMQFITGRNFRGISAELLSDVQPWEGWDELHCTPASSETASQGGPNHIDASSRFISTLVALKSTQLAAAISPSIQITPDDILTLDSAVSCFLNISRAVTKDPHFDALQAILVEWEGLFTSGRDEEDSAVASDAGNNWSGDEWDEGWESFQEEQTAEKEGKKGRSLSVHPLHLCWMEIIKKLVMLSRFRDVLKLLDQSLSKPNGLLLDEDSARTLSHLLLGIDCFVALKIVLLLPYEGIHLQCLDAVEAKLKKEGNPKMMNGDREFLTLVLSSGVISTVVSNSAYHTTSSYLYYLVGHYSRFSQEAQLSGLNHRGRNESKTDESDFLFLFRRILFPCFISELVKAEQQLLAGFLITKFMHTHASLSLINVAEASLSRYLEGQARILQDAEPTLEEIGLCISLGNTVSSLRGKLGSLIQSTFSSLSHNVK